MAQQQRAIGTRAAIIRGAAEAFREHGYGSTTLAGLEAAAGVTKGALYFHFASKEVLALAVIETQHEASIALGAKYLGGTRPGLEAAIMMTFEMAKSLREDPVVSAGIRLTLEASNFSVPVAAPYVDWIDVCRQLLRRAIDEGDAAADLNVSAAAHFISPAFTGVQTVSEVLTGRGDLYQRVEEMWTLLLPGLISDALPAERLASLVALPAHLRSEYAAT
ncbi:MULTISPECIES: ScbR family autoregulator-binding transcription factor [Cryobacterium]|uniref:TetR/AcrR family transcriptional regulator n=1 Tax=Cryobacterium breve TaxID=1259258 RepID=A0ABY2J0V6_9MICO|nr:MULTISPECIES: ScbR family autoregulator-binding transcription factor [Cryobacterium]TFC95956.1 TetR/AcrR family transcriptional regulator [Cryobacterium sp. TmT3-12]TFC97927.1 TetR/AcrR family transcriptional regulator [Cryobacterium breve]